MLILIKTSVSCPGFGIFYFSHIRVSFVRSSSISSLYSPLILSVPFLSSPTNSHSPFPCSAFPCHAKFNLLLNTSIVPCVLRPFSFSSRLIRVSAAATPIEIANKGSSRLSESFSISIGILRIGTFFVFFFFEAYLL